MGQKLKYKINAGLYRNRCLNLSIIEFAKRLQELDMCLNSKNHRKKSKFCKILTKNKKC